MSRYRTISLSLLLFCFQSAFAQKSFEFFALGDMPYHNPADIDKFKKLTDAINSEKPAFTVHVGDIKNGSTECSDEYFYMMLGLLNRFSRPLIYTPGDNEWTDCHRPGAGGYDPGERLATLRKLYFRNAQSLGRNPLQLKSQNLSSGYEQFAENAIWRNQGVTFGTLHVVGSNNNYKPEPSSNDEFLGRDAANLHWLTEIFTTARNNNDAAVVLVMHAAMPYASTEKNGFSNIVDRLRMEVTKFGKPVLLIYGDHHRFQINKPLMDSENNLIENFTALMVFGDREVNAVKISVEPRSREIFSFSEFRPVY